MCEHASNAWTLPDSFQLRTVLLTRITASGPSPSVVAMSKQQQPATRRRNPTRRSPASTAVPSPRQKDTPPPDDVDARQYHSQSYWEQRYQRQLHPTAQPTTDDDDVTSEWYYDWQTLTPLLSLTPRMLHSPVLDIGCGLSSLFSDLLNSGFTGPFVGIDSSPSIIHQRRYAPSPFPPTPASITFDQRNLFTFDPPFRTSHADEEGRYGLIVDKATSDGMMCDEANMEGVGRMYEMVGWSLSPGGTFLLVSVQEPESGWFVDALVPGLMGGDGGRHCWYITVHSIGEGQYYDGESEGPNVYVCVKGERERRSRAAKERGELNEVTVVRKYH